MALGTLNIKLAIGVAVTLIVAVTVVAIVLLAKSPSDPQLPTSAPDGRTGDKAVDRLIDHLLRDDAEELERLVGDVTAREGVPIGGPVGLGNVRTLTAQEWTARLAAAKRSLHAVFRAAGTDKTVPQQRPPFADSGPVVDPGYDFYVVIAAETGNAVATGWRFGLLDGRVVDVIIAAGPPGGAVPPGGSYPVGPKALEPSPLDERDRFLVLPPERDWPAPTPVPRQPAVRDPARSPTFAPDGRTGDAGLDRLIEVLLKGSTSQLRRVADTPGGEERLIEIAGQLGAFTSARGRVPVADWTARLVNSERSLYAVVAGDPADVIVAVDAGGPAHEAWTFAVREGRVIEVAIRSGYVPPQTSPFNLLTRSTPSPAEAYDRFLVLPPEDQLPKPPPGHALSVRTGNAGVDRVMSLLESHDSAGLIASLAEGEMLPVQESCGGEPVQKPRQEPEEALTRLAQQASGVYTIARVPDGYPIAADHVLVVWIRVAPYRWTRDYLLERDGRIAGLLDCVPPAPPTFIVPPPAGGVAGLSQARRSGIAIVDAVLDAIQRGDETALSGLIDYSKMSCPGEYGPQCLPGEPAGTLVDVLPGSVCHGEYSRREEAATYLLNTASYQREGRFLRMSLYAVVPRGQPPEGPSGFDLHSRGTISVLLAGSNGSAVLLGFSEKGVTNYSKKCGPADPQPAVPPGPTSYLLPPPP
jgi:hypothetical protein